MLYLMVIIGVLTSELFAQTDSNLIIDRNKCVINQILCIGGTSIGLIITVMGIVNFNSKPISDTTYTDFYGQKFAHVTTKSNQDLGSKEMIIGIPIALLCSYLFTTNTIKLIEINKRLKINVQRNAVSMLYLF
jgi:hypothetical protein